MKLKDHKIIKTEDGSLSVYSEIYNENAHSTHGAANETELHYIEGCQIREKVKEKKINILEIGFGSGLGFIKTFEALMDHEVLMISYEIQRELIEYFIYEHPEFDVIQKDQGTYYIQENNFELIIKIGDARKLIKNENTKFHAIYQDAYSPRRNPELWTKEWFSDLIEVCESDVIVSTYSASSSIRKAMLAAGFKLYPGEKFGHKRTSTRARILGDSDKDILDHLNRSPVEALQDSMCAEYKKRD